MIANPTREKGRCIVNKKMTVGSLFAGIGGIDLGLEMTGGFITRFQVEKNEYATRVLERRWPGVKRWGDIADFLEIARQPDARVGVDLLCGGFPCVSVSVAGSRKGESDERWLWESLREAIRLVRPRYVLVENVPGLLSAKDAGLRPGGLFGGILSDFSAMGFNAEWGVLPASAFGAPHLRRRVFIVAYTVSQNGSQLELSSRPSERCEEPGRTSKIGTPANSDCNRLRKQPRRRSGESGTGATQSEFTGKAGTPANSDSERCGFVWKSEHAEQQSECGGESYGLGAPGRGEGETHAHTEGGGQSELRSSPRQDGQSDGGCETPPNTISEGSPQRQQQANGQGTLRYEGTTVAESSWRFVEPTVCRVDHAIPKRVDRIRCLGNAVVPPVAQWLGEQILRFNREQNDDSTRSV